MLKQTTGRPNERGRKANKTNKTDSEKRVTDGSVRFAFIFNRRSAIWWCDCYIHFQNNHQLCASACLLNDNNITDSANFTKNIVSYPSPPLSPSGTCVAICNHDGDVCTPLDGFDDCAVVCASIWKSSAAVWCVLRFINSPFSERKETTTVALWPKTTWMITRSACRFRFEIHWIPATDRDGSCWVE